jgi:hypothetical protein
MLNSTSWRRPFIEAAAIVVLVLSLYTYWFAQADRYVIFLYGHTAPGITLTEPFDAMTSSRYWMAGLVAAGVVMLLYTGVNWIGGRSAARRGSSFGTPPWWRVWVLSAPGLIAGIPAITMTANAPVLPLSLAAASAAAALAGLALALMPGRWAADRPDDLLWLMLDGMGLIPTLVFLRAIELPGRGLAVSPAVAWFVAIGAIVGGALWLTLLSVLRRWGERPSPGAMVIFLAGVGLSYTLMPLAHYLTAGPSGFRYITNSGNFFALNPLLQLLAFVAAAGLAFAAVWFRDLLPRDQTAEEQTPRAAAE